EGAVTPIGFPEPEELAPPLMRLDGLSAGYGAMTVLSRIDLRIDQDDRIALLGQNGQGKSTLAKIISGHLAPLAGSRQVSGKLRIGYFAQHQGDELVMEETPLDHYRRALPGLEPVKLRARLAQAGLGAETAQTPVRSLSGGQKARLLLGLAALDKPHLLILDEPTNHLDIESREALVTALNGYSGAVILITHDAHLVELVADRLLLVKDGRVTQYDEDMETYRRMLLADAKSAGRPARETKPAPQKTAAHQARQTQAQLRAEVRACEARLAKIAEMLETIDNRLADPALYDGPVDKIKALNIKRDEILEAQDRAETLWLAAEEALEAAQA
ncbi:MAG: ATP-binding cassette domain-containing protein, partial [Pseudomonadota bacterium]